jgi:sphinganine-1-phosphate aldolase
MRRTLPPDRTPWSALDDRMTELCANDVDWRRGKVPLYVFSASEDVYNVGRDAFVRFFSENALGGKRAFFGLRKMEEDVVDMALGLFGAPPGATGCMTSGGSESIFLAVKACRDACRAARSRRGQLNMVIPYSAHPAFNKAGDTLDIEVRRVPLAPDLRADVPAMEARIDENTILLVGSAPCFPHGVIDPIPALGALAEKRSLWLHVDACVGGYLIPFVRRTGKILPDFDFSVPGVRSISADLHKFGFCPKPASTVFYRSADDFRFQVFDFEDWPNGRFTTSTLVGTRPGGAVAAAWAVLNFLGESGYVEIARNLIALTQRYVDGIRSIPELRLLAEPDLTIINFGSDELDIFAVAEEFQKKNWLTGLTQRPRGMHAMLSMLHEASREEYIETLRRGVKRVRAHSGGPSALRAEY